MLTNPIALALWRKLAQYPPEALRSSKGRALIAKAEALIHARCGESEASIFALLMTVASM